MRIIGIGVAGNGEADRYMRATMEEFKRLCDDVIIATCNADQKTIKLIEEYGFWHYEDNREWGKEQPNIKTDLLRRAGKLRPDWIIALDMDEVFAPEFTREEAERLASLKEIAYYFLVVNLYNDRDHFYHGVGIQRFWNVRFFKYLSGYTEYQRKNLHCGLAPPIYYNWGWHAPYYVEHYGLMTKDDRMKKAERYAKYDPKAKFKSQDYYDDLIADYKPMNFDKKGLLNKLKESPETKIRNLDINKKI